jgi:hypothetical protein
MLVLGKKTDVIMHGGVCAAVVYVAMLEAFLGVPDSQRRVGFVTAWIWRRVRRALRTNFILPVMKTCMPCSLPVASAT